MVATFCPPPFLTILGNTLSASFIGLTQVSHAAATTISAAGVSIGEPEARRLVVAVVHYYRTSDPPLSSVTIGGVAATIIAQPWAQNVGVAVAYAVVPSGTSATISCTFARVVAANSVRIGVYRIVGQEADAPVQFGTALGSDTASTISIATRGGGCVIAASSSQSAVGISGVTQNYAYTGTLSEVGKAGLLFPSAESPSATFSSNIRAFIAASWR